MNNPLPDSEATIVFVCLGLEFSEAERTPCLHGCRATSIEACIRAY